MAGKLVVSFAAGLLGFLSPCVLPLLPAYVGYMTGGAAGERVSVRRALPGTLAFVAGLTVVFTALFAGATAISGILRDHKKTIEIVAGAFIIGLGLLMVGVTRLPFLWRERRFHIRPGGGPWRTFVLGAAFAFGWTPCIGLTLGAAINLAATTDGLGQGIALLVAYALGLGVPFVLAGLGLVSFGGRIKRHALKIQFVGGILLVGAGILVVTGRLTLITIWGQKLFTRLGIDLWNVL